jgi:hypothetical protein
MNRRTLYSSIIACFIVNCIVASDINYVRFITAQAKQKTTNKDYLEYHKETYRDILEEIDIRQRAKSYITLTEQKANFAIWQRKIIAYKQESLQSLHGNLPYKSWNQVKTFITKTQNACNEYKSCALKEVNHSLSHAKLLEFIKKTLTSHDVSPYRFSIIDSVDSSEENHFFYIKPTCIKMQNNSGILVMQSDKDFEPGVLSLNIKKISELPPAAQYTVCLQAIQSLIAPDAIIPYILEEFFKIKFPNQYTTILGSDTFKTMQNLCLYTFPIVSQAFQDSVYASQMYHYFLENPDPNFHSWQLLCYIYLNWKMLKV